MSQLNTQVKEQRCATRMAIGESVEFRTSNDEEFRVAMMVDFSEAGMLLLMKEDYPVGSKLEVRVKDEEALYFTVKCVRSAPCTDIELNSYGCVIEEHHFAAE
ncbi:MAG: PilZ domain-containing protein [Gammaproteobacteria bacterium]|nr:PilZ domain-containing protein [Gammaproteobacteria bacterium]